MKNSQTFSIYFWLKKTAIKKDGQVPIYARITVDGIRADVSLKRFIKGEHWNPNASRMNPRLAKSKDINQYLDKVYSKLLDCHKQLHEEDGTIRPIHKKALSRPGQADIDP